MKPVTSIVCHSFVLDIRDKLSATDVVKRNVGNIQHIVADVVNGVLFDILRQTLNVGHIIHEINI